MLALPPFRPGPFRSQEPEINCPIIMLCSELGSYFACTELETNQGHTQLINEIMSDISAIYVVNI
jgi:flagellar basal body-associated protein FliL